MLREAKCVFGILLFLCFSVTGSAKSAAPVAATGDPQAIARVHFGDDRTEIGRLREQGYDIAGINVRRQTVDVILRDHGDEVALNTFGFKVQRVKTLDLSMAPDRGYVSSEELETYLKAWGSKYPKLAHVESIGKSLEGRDIWAVRIGSPGQAKPTILFNGEHHAREVMTPEVVLDTGDYLLSQYDTNPKVRSWLDHMDVWLLPMLNPDGNYRVWHGQNMWRKNGRSTYGVDINRNYPYKWASCGGSSESTWSDSYHGTGPASEPETQVMMSLVKRIRPSFNISYHSYSEMVLYPYGCNGAYAEQRDLIEPIGRDMANLVPSETGSGTYTAGTPWELLYDVDGADIDWMYHEEHVLAFAIEVTSDESGFQPPYSHRQQTVESLRPAWQYLLDRLQKGGVTGQVRGEGGAPVADAVVLVASTSEPGTIVAQSRTRADGSYHVVLNPGDYRITAVSGDARTAEQHVSVADAPATLHLTF